MVKSISIRKKLVLAIFIVSSIATTLTVLTSSFFDYRLEMSHFEKVIDSVEVQNLETISKLSWDLNVDQIQLQVESIIKLPEVIGAKVKLKDSTNQLTARREGLFENTLVKSYPLQFQSDDVEHDLGVLEIEYNRDAVVNKVLEKLVMTILLNFLKAFAISFLLMSVFQLLITSRIEKLSETIAHLSESKFKNGYRPKKNNKRRTFFQRWDEINRLEHQIRRMSRFAGKNFERMEIKIAEQSGALESQRAKAAYASKMASLGEMASGVAHEINNPLTIMTSRLHLLERRVQAHLKSIEGVDEFSRSLNPEIAKLMQLTVRISKIVKGLKTFARDGSKDPMEWVSLKEIVNDSIQLVSRKAQSHEISISSEIEELEVFCRPVEMSQVFVNLVGNSTDAILNQREKWIKIVCRLDGNSVVIEVWDSGPGIAAEVQTNMMQPFFTTKPAGQGTGLGLSISKGIIESHQGQFAYLPDSPSTCFQIKLPLSHVRLGVRSAS